MLDLSPAILGLRRSLIPVALVALLLGATDAQAHRTRPRGPIFGGLKSATTCTPGPVKPNQTSSYHLEWQAAKDRMSPSRRIVYEVYLATAPGEENFSTPTYTTSPGATSFDTPQLPIEDTFYFVVRARDRRGQEDSNTVEREGQDLCVKTRAITGRPGVTRAASRPQLPVRRRDR